MATMNHVHPQDPLRGIPMEALRSFEASARHLNFTRAAAELNLTQSAVSHAIGALEQRIGTQLFERDKGRLHLTACGEVLRQEVQAALSVLRCAIERASGAQARNVVSLRAVRSIAVGWLIPKIVDFNKSHPNIDVRIALAPRAGTAEDRATSDERFRYGCDLAIRLLPRESAEGRLKRLGLEYVFPCCTAEVSGHGDWRHRNLRDLFKHPLLEFDDGLVKLSGNWPVWAKLTGIGSLEGANMVHVPDWASVYGLAVSGKGVCLGRTPHVSHHLRNGTLTAPIPEVLISREAFYLLPSATIESDSNTQHFVDWLTGEFEREQTFEAAFLQGRRVIDPLTG
jgi:LysR family transcriptional regulator, glycine cleavage system transcriptional activator